MAVNDIITRTEAGDLVPIAERREILKGLVASSAVRQLARTIQMSTKVERQPVLSALPAAYWVDGDTGLKQTTKAEWDNKTMTAEEIAVILPVPEALLADSTYDIFGEMRPLIVEAIGVKLDEAVLFGTDNPTSWTDAIVPGAQAANNAYAIDTAGDIAEDINQVMALVEEDGFDVTAFAARLRLRARLRGLRDANQGLLFSPSLQAGTPGTLYDTPIVYSDANGAWSAEGVDLIAGDWSKAVLGVRQDITFKLFTEGVISNDAGAVVMNLMQQDTVALRVVARFGFAVANPINRRNAVEADRYPFAVLETNEGS